jgi:hypothetical protein
MKIACLILAHKNPVQLNELIEILDCNEIDFYIHLDKKVKKKNFDSFEEKNNVFFIENRVSTKWATFSLVQATINSLREIVNKEKYDYINFISGQDLPIKSKNDIVQFLRDNDGTEFITTIPFSKYNEWWIENERRVFNYNFQNWKIPFKYKIQKLVNLITQKRENPNGYIISGNAQWFCITTNCAKYIINTIDTNKKLVTFFKYVWGADEFLFSTIVYNSPFKQKTKENLTYVDWEIQNKGHPKTLMIDDFEKIMASDKLFERKFDINIDQSIINKIKNKIQLKEYV